MEDEIVHNFCESRLNNYQAPEILNSYTSLFITFIPLIYGLPKNTIFYNISSLLMFNGFASFYYHYTLSWIGKQADEVSMILSVYLGIWRLINMYYSENKNYYSGINSIFMTLTIIFNTIQKNDLLFPLIFSMYVFVLLYHIYKTSKLYNIAYKKELLISFIGAKCWIISEIYCNDVTKFGHIVWHIMFPLGFYKLILKFDKINSELPK